MTALEFLQRLGGTVTYVYPPIPIRTQDYQATHPAFADHETGGEVSIGHGATAEAAARFALEVMVERIEEVLE